MEMLKVLESVIATAMGKEPRAWLYEVQLVMKETDDGQVHPEDLYQMKVVFGMPTNQTLTYEVSNEGEIVEHVIKEPWLEDLPMPHKILNGLEAAYDRMRQANLAYEKVYPAVTLRHPLYIGVVEPSYFFSVEVNGGQEFVSVGLFSANVQFTK